jgi:hypothetical protein
MEKITMRVRDLLGILLPLGALAWSCAKKEEAPPPQPYGQQPTYGQPAPQQQGQPAQPAPVQQPAQTAPATASTTSQPSPMAFPCQTDDACVTHRCNTQVGRCAWPCQSEADCRPGNQCISPACVPTTVAPPAQ